jgi:hypothetical protein
MLLTALNYNENFSTPLPLGYNLVAEMIPKGHINNCEARRLNGYLL